MIKNNKLLDNIYMKLQKNKESQYLKIKRVGKLRISTISTLASLIPPFRISKISKENIANTTEMLNLFSQILQHKFIGASS